MGVSAMASVPTILCTTKQWEVATLDSKAVSWL